MANYQLGEDKFYGRVVEVTQYTMNVNHAYETDNGHNNGYGNGKNMNGAYTISQVDQYPKVSDLEIGLEDREQAKLDKEPLKICVWITKRPGTVFGKRYCYFTDENCFASHVFNFFSSQ